MQQNDRKIRICETYCYLKNIRMPKNEKEIDDTYKKATTEMIFIYFDMDNVLADFDRGVKEILNMEPMKQGEYNPEKANEIFKAIQEKIAEGTYFYKELKPNKEVVELFKELHSLYGDYVQVLTGIPSEEKGIKNARENKLNWIKEYIGDDIIVNTVTRKEKINYCHNEDCILIDDSTANIENWKKVGGTAILYKNPQDLRRKLYELIDFISVTFSDEDMSIHYDKRTDTMYIDFPSKWKDAANNNGLNYYGEEYNNNNDFVTLRKDSNDEIIGYVVSNYSKHLNNKKINKFPWQGLDFEKDLLPLMNKYFEEIEKYIEGRD